MKVWELIVLLKSYPVGAEVKFRTNEWVAEEHDDIFLEKEYDVDYVQLDENRTILALKSHDMRRF
jgi:hypothetical protein